jgi:energy-coupling factor transporter ATP-binding protein EcfA2
MRKLTVKNFSVIKEAELEFGKITVLIGPQASGKSVLCKLAYFLSKRLLELAVDSISLDKSEDEFRNLAVAEFAERFPVRVPGAAYNIEFDAGNYSVSIFGHVANNVGASALGLDQDAFVNFEFSTQFITLYTAMTHQSQNGQSSGASGIVQKDEIWTQLNLLLSGDLVLQSLYAPAGRAFFTNTSLGFKARRNPDIDPIIDEFAAEIAWGRPWRHVGQVTAGDDVLDSIKQKMDQIVRGEVKVVGSLPRFNAFDGRNLSLSNLSSGTQEMLPLFNVLGRLASDQESREINVKSTFDPPREIVPVRSRQLVYVEEPEANVFPSTQYELVRLFARLTHEPNLDFSWVITTHSPYILTAFNTLIEAWRAGNKPGKREHYWINESDFAAYTIRDGVLIPIFEKEQEGKEGSGLIDGDYLDSVSDQLGGQFDKLLDIEYAN